MIPNEAVDAAANAISQSSGMRFDGFWSRIEDLEPEDREYALQEARAALEAAAPYIQAAAWDEGEAAGQDNVDSNRGYNIEHKYNPYTRQKQARG